MNEYIKFFKKNIVLLVVLAVLSFGAGVVLSRGNAGEIVVTDGSSKSSGISDAYKMQPEDNYAEKKNGLTHAEPVKNSEVTVFLSGQVKEQKVVTLPEGSRLNDAVDMCGGLTENADLSRINLALKLTDQAHYILPAKGEALPEAKSAPDLPPANSNSPNEPNSAQSSRVNLNTADKSALMSLDGIGEKTADRIIDYRNKNGKFSSIDDLKNVGGIGDKKFEAVKDDITV